MRNFILVVIILYLVGLDITTTEKRKELEHAIRLQSDLIQILSIDYDDTYLLDFMSKVEAYKELVELGYMNADYHYYEELYKNNNEKDSTK